VPPLGAVAVIDPPSINSLVESMRNVPENVPDGEKVPLAMVKLISDA
jgi:hypothetical protein